MARSGPNWHVHTKKGYEEAVKELQQWADGQLAGMQIAEEQRFLDMCQNVLQLAKDKAPLDTGTLRGTAFLEVKDMTDTEGVIRARVEFPEEYALVQHEHWEFHHENGQAFYLSLAFDEAVAEYMAGR